MAKIPTKYTSALLYCDACNKIQQSAYECMWRGKYIVHCEWCFHNHNLLRENDPVTVKSIYRMNSEEMD